jgi:transposase
LLPADVDDEREAMISSSPRDKHSDAEHRCLARMAHQRSRQAIFDRVHALRKEGGMVIDIVRQTGLDRRTIAKWIRADTLPQHNASSPKTSSPRRFEDHLSRRWAEGCMRGRRLFQEIKARGYTGSFSNLERLLAKWRTPKRKVARPALSPPRAQAVVPATGRSISPIVAAALCVKPRGLLTSTQAAKVDAMKCEWPDFATMPRLAMRFRGIVRSKSTGKLATWLKDAQQAGLYAMQRFARTLHRDIDAVEMGSQSFGATAKPKDRSIV